MVAQEIITPRNSVKIGTTEYKLKHKMTMGQIRKARTIAAPLLQLKEQVATANDEQLEKISASVISSQSSYEELVINTIIDCLDITIEQLESCQYIDVILAFNDLYELSLAVPKKP